MLYYSNHSVTNFNFCGFYNKIKGISISKMFCKFHLEKIQHFLKFVHADNLAANFSRELADYIIYIIDVSAGDKIPRKGGPGITQADLLVCAFFILHSCCCCGTKWMCLPVIMLTSLLKANNKHVRCK